MYQGETATTKITGFPVEMHDIENIHIIFISGNKIVIEKQLADCTIIEDGVEFTLSQQESLSLNVGKVSRSCIVITKDGTRFESSPSIVSVEQTAKNEVLS